jgi:hypothetical protein
MIPVLINQIHHIYNILIFICIWLEELIFSPWFLVPFSLYYQTEGLK